MGMTITKYAKVGGTCLALPIGAVVLYTGKYCAPFRRFVMRMAAPKFHAIKSSYDEMALINNAFEDPPAVLGLLLQMALMSLDAMVQLGAAGPVVNLLSSSGDIASWEESALKACVFPGSFLPKDGRRLVINFGSSS